MFDLARTKSPVYSFDFETIVNPNETRVWLWGSVNLSNEHFEHGNNLESFIKAFSCISCTGYFHNLKFDIQFIFYWLLKNGYKHTSERYPPEGCFSTLISDMGVFYSAKIHFINGGVMTLFDSLKIIPMSVSEMPKAFGLSIKKLEIEYEEERDLNHIPTDNEIKYVHNDCLIVAQALKHMFNQGMTKMTAASNAMYYFKKSLDKNEFDRLFPQIHLSVDKDCRKAYKGGWTYLNDEYKDKIIYNGRVYDVNSMYSWAMSYCELPWGLPIYYEGKYENDEQFPLFIQCMKCKFELKDGSYPSIQIKSSFKFLDTEYLKSSKGETVLLHLTSVDYKLLLDTYNLSDVEYICGYKFRSVTGLFKNYIDHWYGVKNQAKHDKNWPIYLVAKLMLNSLYGKFGSNPEKASKYPYLDKETDTVKYSVTIKEIGKTAYVPVAAFITSHCRNKIIRAAIACGSNFVYADTDSIHIIGNEPDIDIDDYRLGAFKLESEFTKGKFHRAKCYIEEIGGVENKKCAGLPVKARDSFTFETMSIGYSFDGKLVPKNVKGGVILEKRKFTIK